MSAERDARAMSQAKTTAARKSPAMKDIVSQRDSQLRLVTSVRLRWAAVLGQLIAVAVIMGIYGFPMEAGSCLVLIAMSAWLNVFLSIRYPARHRLSAGFFRGLLDCKGIVWLHAAIRFFAIGHCQSFALRAFAPMF